MGKSMNNLAIWILILYILPILILLIYDYVSIVRVPGIKYSKVYSRRFLLHAIPILNLLEVLVLLMILIDDALRWLLSRFSPYE